jgi:hypothetical protein
MLSEYWHGAAGVYRGCPSAHFLQRLDRLERLRFEAADSEVPEHRRRGRHRVGSGARQAVEADVQDRLAVALHQSCRTIRLKRSARAVSCAVGSNRQIQAIGVSKRRVVTRGARDVFLT